MNKKIEFMTILYLKALEIIVKKGVAVGMLQLEGVGLQEYNDFIGDKKLYLTQGEYDLLKEMLSWSSGKKSKV